jgi:hypothetical protein
VLDWKRRVSRACVAGRGRYDGVAAPGEGAAGGKVRRIGWLSGAGRPVSFEVNDGLPAGVIARNGIAGSTRRLRFIHSSQSRFKSSTKP